MGTATEVSSPSSPSSESSNPSFSAAPAQALGKEESPTEVLQAPPMPDKESTSDNKLGVPSEETSKSAAAENEEFEDSDEGEEGEETSVAVPHVPLDIPESRPSVLDSAATDAVAP